MAKGKDQSEWKKKMYDIIFKSDTFHGKLFDEVLLVVILISVGVVMLESIPEVRLTHGTTLFTAEWVFYHPIPRRVYSSNSLQSKAPKIHI